MDALCRGVWMDALSRGGWMDMFGRSVSMVALNTGG